MRILAAFLGLALAFSLPLDAQIRRRAVRGGGGPPAGCVVQGLAGVFRSTDGGQTFLGNSSSSEIDFLYDIDFLEDPPATAIAASLHAIYDSSDGGCSWTKRYTITRALHHPVQLSTGPNGRAFIWSDEILLRYNRSSVEELNAPLPIGALMVDPADNRHVRMFAVVSGLMWISGDGGETWTNSGRGVNTVVRGGAQDPADFNHILLATGTGLQISRDGGDSWTTVQGLNRTVCEIDFVRHSANVVWLALNIMAGSDTVYRSDNGGSSFEAVAEIPSDAAGACLPMVTQPFDPNRAVVVFRDVYTVDAVTRSVTTRSCCNGNLLRTAYSPVDSKIVLMFSAGG